MERSLGMVEVIGFIPAITAADGGLKAADVTLWQVMKADGGIVTVCFSGDVSAVQSAVDAAAMSVDTLGCERFTSLPECMNKQRKCCMTR